MAIPGLVLLLWLFIPVTTDSGTLRVESLPGTEVIWEGVSLGTTDRQGVLLVSDIPPGRFEIILSKAGFEEVRRLVKIEANEASLLRAGLDRSAAPGPQTAPPAAAAPPEAGEQLQLPPDTEQYQPPASVQASESARGSASPPQDSTSAWPLLLVPVVAFLVMYFLRRFRPAALVPAPPALLSQEDRPQEDRLEPPDLTPRTTSFLRDLKKREELLEQGVEVERPRKGPVIDLDAGSVRKIEDQ
jgi:hypothetical protein